MVPDKLPAVKLVKLAPLTAPKKALQVPEEIVPTEVKLEVTTVGFNIVDVSVCALAVAVPDPPREIEVPLTVIELLFKALLGILLKLVPANVAAAPIATFCGVLIVKVLDVPVIVTPLVLVKVIIPLLYMA